MHVALTSNSHRHISDDLCTRISLVSNYNIALQFTKKFISVKGNLFIYEQLSDINILK